MKKGEHKMNATISYAAIILADIPYNESNPHMHHGKHFYVIVSNEKACTYSPVVQAIPMSSNINRHLPVQVEVPRTILEQGKHCGFLSVESIHQLNRAIKVQLALD